MYTSLLYSPFPYILCCSNEIYRRVNQDCNQNEMIIKQGRKNEMLRDIFSGIFRVRTDCGESWRERQETRMEDGEGRWKVDWERVDSS